MHAWIAEKKSGMVMRYDEEGIIKKTHTSYAYCWIYRMPKEIVEVKKKREKKTSCNCSRIRGRGRSQRRRTSKGRRGNRVV